MKPRQKTTTNMPHPCFLYFFLALQKTLTSLYTHHCLLQLKKKKKTKTKTHKRMTSLPVHQHPLQPKKKNLDVGLSWVARDDNKPPSSSLSLIFFSSVVENDDEQGGSSLFFTFFLHL
jgi:LAS superfamily LD-carboxypeptidase LdcB